MIEEFDYEQEKNLFESKAQDVVIGFIFASTWATLMIGLLHVVGVF